MSRARDLADSADKDIAGTLTLDDLSVSGTVTGNVTGDLTGDVTGNLTGDTIGTHTGAVNATNITVTGVVTGNVTGDILGDVKADNGTVILDSGTNGRNAEFTGDVDISAIAATISDTAVDIFVYDTRKDSDGGAWRKRTQHTSWYNETLNTATRGSRKEFPAVAVIVAESNQVTIYDGDDPDMPMWMVFNVTGGGAIFGDSTNVIQSVVCLNGWMSVGSTRPSTTGNLSVADFIGDQSGFVYNNASDIRSQGNIADRNSTSQYPSGTSNFFTSDPIVNRDVNDVAMTVLPNAPIDAATGLPVPTIAVATNGGVSVIKDDGTVVDGVYTGGNSDSHTIALKSDGTIAWTHENGPYFLGKLWEADWSTGTGVNVKPRIDGSMFYPAASGDYLASVGLNTTCTINAAGSFSGLTKVDVPSGSDASVNGMVNFITSDYNTGWMNGDIKLATLSDTDDTNVTGSELITNGTFDTDTSGWTAFFGTISVTGGVLQLTSASNYNYAQQTITGLTVGETYVLSVDVLTGNNNTMVYVRNGSTTVINITGTGTKALTFVAPATSLDIWLYQIYASTSTFDNVSLRKAEEDRSVNGNGLQVFGTVTKSAVATGADLVAYSGWSNNNYLKQPYNSTLPSGGSDPFAVMMWFKVAAVNNTQVVVQFGTNATGELRQFNLNSTGNPYFAMSGQNTGNSRECEDNVWHHWATVHDGNKNISTFIDGDLIHTQVFSGLADASTEEPLWVGNDYNGDNGFSGSLALLRISATAPSPDQILKIYNDEKHLFTEGAQATLYGSSDAVTALAYDDSTELLHVGTSAGRSVFQGLRRIDNTTTAVGAAISASNGLVADE